jgi:hypothetical protein
LKVARARTTLQSPPYRKALCAFAREILLLVDILNPAIIDESADPVPISADRTGLGATVTLPHAPNIREPLRIRPPGLHQASLSLAHTVVHKNQNAPLIAAMTAQVGRVRDIIRSDVAEESAQCTHMLTLLKIKRGSGQCAQQRAWWIPVFFAYCS